MRMLRSTSYGGVGRLEQTRREVRIASGEIVPVSMTASTVYEGDREVATVGILTDLRDRIRMEQRLLDAQQKLQMSEKQALVAELAGAAAHELNQPLTSIMGYAQLIERQSDKAAAHLRAVGVILSEAERMAGIVKKIGKITKYETTDYVGSARMLDLDRASSNDADAVVQPSDGEQTGEFQVAQTGAPIDPDTPAELSVAHLPDDDVTNVLTADMYDEATAIIRNPKMLEDDKLQHDKPRSSDVADLERSLESGMRAEPRIKP
jgi:signal transduction histidine kinase